MNPKQLALIDQELDADRLRDDTEVDEMLRGAVDLHVHPSPSPFPRRIGIADAAMDAEGRDFARSRSSLTTNPCRRMCLP